jgi:hypothetical protein
VAPGQKQQPGMAVAVQSMAAASGILVLVVPSPISHSLFSSWSIPGSQAVLDSNFALDVPQPGISCMSNFEGTASIKYFTVLRPRDVAFRYQSQSPDSPVPILERIIGLLSWHFLFLLDMNYFSSCPQYSIPTDLAFQSCLPMSSTKSHHCNHQHYFYLPTQVARQCPDRSLLYRSSSSVRWSRPGRIRRRPSYGDVGLLAMKNTPAPKISWTTMTRRHLKIQLLLVGLQITPLSMGQL